MLDHISFGVVDLDRAIRFHDQALAPLGMKRLMSVTAQETGGPPFAGYGDAGPCFWIGDREASRGPPHVAFTARDRATVDGFYKAALVAGGRENGALGRRAHHHPNYYGAFVLDPEGRNIEAV